MAPFNVTIRNKEFTITPMEDGSFVLFSGDHRYGRLYKDKLNNEKGWVSDEEVDQYLLELIIGVIEQRRMLDIS